MSAELRRPTSIDEVKARLQYFSSDKSKQACTTFTARPDDVFICTYSKSGTTWMQQIVHQLRSGASMDFEEISSVVPWFELAVDTGIDPHADQPWEPRAFKSHLTYTEAPKGARYITVFRDPATVLPSFYNFFDGWWFEKGSITVEDFAMGLYLGGTASGQHWDHLVDWWPLRHRDDVLAVCYEDLVANSEAVPQLVADYLALDVSPELMERVVANSSRKVMLDHSHKFDDHVLRTARHEAWGLPPDEGFSSKVTSGSAVEIAPAVQDAMDAKWAEVVEAALGFDSYAAFRASITNPFD
ncbi:MAG: sulfotransferase domain-containing protein [Acidimicrobiales bacterium]|nr:sulfotransferase domain-containing protein [Acidimicrobiales bacterium]RZV47374.1 MAG: sulfotransferase domain-containing protein [Acidimicrobiales bacterium]